MVALNAALWSRRLRHVALGVVVVVVGGMVVVVVGGMVVVVVVLVVELVLDVLLVLPPAPTTIW